MAPIWVLQLLDKSKLRSHVIFILITTMIFATGGSSEEKEEFADLRTDDANALTKESDIM